MICLGSVLSTDRILIRKRTASGALSAAFGLRRINCPDCPELDNAPK